MKINDFVKIISLEINGHDRDPEGLIDFCEPDKDTPYWLSTFEGGKRIVATGNVEVIYKRRYGEC